jgi:hypothetical protein
MTSPTAIPAPISAEESYMLNTFKKYDYTLDVQTFVPQATQFLLYRLTKLVEDENPMVSLKAIEAMGRTHAVGLFSSRVEVSFSDETDAQLRARLEQILAKNAINIADFII